MSEPAKIVKIYNVEGIKKEKKAIIRDAGTYKVEDNEQVHDTLVNTFPVVGDVYAALYLCNITHIYLLSTFKLPMFHVIVYYNPKFYSEILFDMWFFFTLTGKAETYEELVENPRAGEFLIEIKIRKDLKIDRENVQIPVKEYCGHKKIGNYILSILSSDKIKKTINELVDSAREKKSKEVGGMFPEKLPEPTISLKV